MAARKLTISWAAGRGPIEIDDVRVRGVRGFTVRADVNSVPTATLDVIVREAVIDGEAHVDVPDKTRETLIHLGWTPPVEPAPGEPEEIADLPPEVRTLVHAVDRMRENWAEVDEAGRRQIWQRLHEANEAVWNRRPPTDDR